MGVVVSREGRDLGRASSKWVEKGGVKSLWVERDGVKSQWVERDNEAVKKTESAGKLVKNCGASRRMGRLSIPGQDEQTGTVCRKDDHHPRTSRQE